jgi:hypothetical protein
LARVTLDGLELHVPHQLQGDDAARRLEGCAEELKRSWSRWGVRVERAETGLRVAGEKGQGRFAAHLSCEPGRIAVKVEGTLELSFLELTVAGGQKGVRDRVRDEVTKIIRSGLEA